jgi:hypothetical protein
MEISEKNRIKYLKSKKPIPLDDLFGKGTSEKLTNDIIEYVKPLKEIYKRCFNQPIGHLIVGPKEKE